MADIDDRWHRTVVDPITGESRQERTTRYGRGTRYAARWRDDNNRQRSRSFTTRRDAAAWLAKVAVDLAKGEYVDPAAGKVRLRSYATTWLANQTFEESTRESVEIRLRVHILPTFGGHEMRAIRPSMIQAWTRGLQGSLGATTIRVVYANLSAIFAAAVADGVLARNPCRSGSARPPAKPVRKVVPWPERQVSAVRAALPERYRELVTLGAGAGLRQGEIFALAVEDVDFFRGVIHVRRQVKIVGSRLVFSDPKRGKQRDVPLAQSVKLRLAAHLRQHPASPVTLPWKVPGGKPTTARLIFVTRERGALNRNYFNAGIWKPALRAASVPDSRENGMHALRHFYASVVLEGGASIRDLSDWLGHADPGFTLRTYAHLLPNSSSRMREAIDRVLDGAPADGLAMGGAPDVRQAPR
ncbi:MAG: site-specific integrase [Kineosporiaceae bacterium]|nr:site-specific integrase [Kineosporiaceae bacterium]